MLRSFLFLSSGLAASPEFCLWWVLAGFELESVFIAGVVRSFLASPSNRDSSRPKRPHRITPLPCPLGHRENPQPLELSSSLPSFRALDLVTFRGDLPW